MGELPPGLDIDNLDALLASMPPGMMEELGIDDDMLRGDGGELSMWWGWGWGWGWGL